MKQNMTKKTLNRLTTEILRQVRMWKHSSLKNTAVSSVHRRLMCRVLRKELMNRAENMTLSNFLLKVAANNWQIILQTHSNFRVSIWQVVFVLFSIKNGVLRLVGSVFIN